MLTRPTQLAVTALISIATAARGQNCDLQILEPPGETTVAIDVSATGDVVIGYRGSSSGAWRWTESTGLQDIPTLGGNAVHESIAVSADGNVVVGTSSVAHNDLEHAFRWIAAIGSQDLGTLGGLSSYARAVSADGNVVVGLSYNSAGTGRAFRWTEAVGMQDLGTGGMATAVSSDGSVVVGAAGSAFRWTVSGGTQVLGTFGGTTSNANAVSADGSTVVGVARNALGQDRAFRWTVASGLEDLGTLGGSTFSPVARRNRKLHLEQRNQHLEGSVSPLDVLYRSAVR